MTTAEVLKLHKHKPGLCISGFIPECQICGKPVYGHSSLSFDRDKLCNCEQLKSKTLESTMNYKKLEVEELESR